MELIRDTLGDPKLAKQVAAASEELINHPIYHTLKTPSDLCIYMEQHVFAVWDFMSLLKRLQQDLTSVQIPWLPSANPEFTRFINEIVLDEESDQDGEGTHISHFMLYRQAMAEVGADQEPIQNFLALVAQAVPVSEALAVVPLAENTAQFVHSTIELAHNGATHEVAAAFFYGRENVIPDMFGQMIAEASGKSTASRFVYYLRRHIELDGDQHGPLAENLALSQREGGRLGKREMPPLGIHGSSGQIFRLEHIVGIEQLQSGASRAASVFHFDAAIHPFSRIAAKLYSG